MGPSSSVLELRARRTPLDLRPGGDARRALAVEFEARWISRTPKPDVKTIKQITRVGGPIGVSGTIFTMIYVILGRQLSALQGGAALAALAVGHRIEAVSHTITEGRAVGVATVVGQWRGAGIMIAAAESAFQASRYGALSMVPLSLLAFAFATVQQPTSSRRTPQYHKPPRTRAWRGASPSTPSRRVLMAGASAPSARFYRWCSVCEGAACGSRLYSPKGTASTLSGGPSRAVDHPQGAVEAVVF